MKTLTMAAVAASGLMALSSQAAAADFSFTGTFTADNDVQFFDFNVGAASTVTLVTYSYAGGVNAAGDTIARGGFDPILSLYDLATGDRVDSNDDGGCGHVASDAVSGKCYDTYLQDNLAAGHYRVAVTQYDNFGPSNLSGPFAHAGDPHFTQSFGPFPMFNDVSGAANNPRDGHWAFDVLGADQAVIGGGGGGGVPEPATWALLLGGFGLAGAALRRRRTVLAA